MEVTPKSETKPLKIDFDQIRELLAVVSQTDITELSIESGDQKVTVKKAAPVMAATTIEIPSAHAIQAVQAPAAQVQPAAVKTAEAAAPEAAAANGWVPITSPMVGTFYRSPSPSAPSFVDVNDVVTVGQTVCIIEAMKLMNDLPTEIAGRIKKVCVENGTTVEYGQTLFMIDPKG